MLASMIEKIDEDTRLCDINTSLLKKHEYVNLCLYAVKRSYKNMKFIPIDEFYEKIYVYAVYENPLAMNFIKQKIPESMYPRIIKKNTDMIKYMSSAKEL